MSIHDKATAVMEKVGGQENVATLEHCATRLRFKMKDMSKVDVEGIKAIPEIVGVRTVGNGLQVIIGQEVDDVYDDIMANYTFTGSDDKDSATSAPVPSGENEKKENLFFRVMAVVSDCLVPMLPALIAAGLTSAILTCLTSFGWLSAESQAYKIIDLLADAPLYFIPFMVVYGTAKKFEVSPIISFAVMGILIHPTFLTLAGEGQNYAHLFGIPIRMFSYSSTVIPPMLCVILQKYVESFFKKYIPKQVAVFLEPLLSFWVLALIMMVIVGPIGAYLGDALAAVLISGGKNYAWLIGLILGSLGSFVVGTGLHYVTMPVVILMFSQQGFDSFYGGITMAGAFALAGAVLGAAFKAKNSSNRQVFFSTGLTALLGISEPAVYGVFFKQRAVMISSMVVGALASCLSGFIGVKSYGMAPAGLFSIPAYAGETFVNLLIVVAVAFVGSFAMSFVMFKDEK